MRDIVRMLKNAQSQDVVVIGDVMLDEYVIGSVERISPEAPVPVLKEEKIEQNFGGAANVAINCKHVGCNVHLIGLIGAYDMPGKVLLSMLQEKHIHVDGIVQTSERKTICKKRIMSQNQQLVRIDSEQVHPLSAIERDELVANIRAAIKPGCIVLLSDYAKGMIDHHIVAHVVVCAQKVNALVVVDPKGPHFDKYQDVSFIKPNLKEFREIVYSFGLPVSDSIVENGKRICEKLGLRGLIVTMGEKGIQFVSPNTQFFYPSDKRDVFDITGAGDTVLVFLALGLVNEVSIEESVQLANKAAGVSVSHLKNYVVSLDELLDDHPESNEKIFLNNWGRLKAEIDWLRTEQSKKIVFTNGCFDLLHSGHIYALQEAQKRGDVLVVALNTDESVKRLKGDQRPIKNLAERMTVMAALEMVDCVVSFDQDTPYELISYLKPDVLVKGGDYKAAEVVGYDVVTAYGGFVEIINYQVGKSTSNFVNAIEKKAQEES